jgi:hypothetical protein
LRRSETLTFHHLETRRWYYNVVAIITARDFAAVGTMAKCLNAISYFIYTWFGEDTDRHGGFSTILNGNVAAKTRSGRHIDDCLVGSEGLTLEVV